LTKVGVLELTPDIAPPDAWYVPAGTSWQREFLDLMGIGADQRIDATKQPHVQADCLVVPMPPSMVENMPPWAVEFLRSRLLPKVDTSGPRRNVYVTRGPSANNRSIVNEPELIKLLAEYDFEHVDPGQLSVADQIRTFATANIIVAPHGAAQANIIFAPHGSSLVELFPAGCVLPYFWRLACSVPGMRYRYVSAHGGPRRPTAARTLTRDIDVDIAAVEATLKELS
jgi:capsular polysaccharide biosynthesis protein